MENFFFCAVQFHHIIIIAIIIDMIGLTKIIYFVGFEFNISETKYFIIISFAKCACILFLCFSLLEMFPYFAHKESYCFRCKMYVLSMKWKI